MTDEYFKLDLEAATLQGRIHDAMENAYKFLHLLPDHLKPFAKWQIDYPRLAGNGRSGCEMAVHNEAIPESIIVLSETYEQYIAE